MRRTRLFVLACMAVFSCVGVMLGINYAWNRAAFADPPLMDYDLTINAECFLSDKPLPLSEEVAQEILSCDKILLLSERTEKPSVAGLYDPAFCLASWQRTIEPGIVRYFSRADYEQRAKVALLANQRKRWEDPVNFSSEDGWEILFWREPIQKNKDEECYSVQNLLAWEDLGNKIYIDGDLNQAQGLIDRLEENGYSKQPSKLPSLFHVIGAVGISHFRPVSLLFAIGIVFLLSIFAFYFYFRGEKDVFSIAFASGADRKSLFKREYASFYRYFLTLTAIMLPVLGYLLVQFSSDPSRLTPLYQTLDAWILFLVLLGVEAGSFYFIYWGFVRAVERQGVAL